MFRVDRRIGVASSNGAGEAFAISCAAGARDVSICAPVATGTTRAAAGTSRRARPPPPPAIGGANEKIEGFFDICKARGLTGEQGTLIPQSNIQNLMLRHDVLNAVRDGLFHVYAVSTIDEGIEILTGVPAGIRDDSGTFPANSINGRVEARLIQLAEQRYNFARNEILRTSDK